MLVTPFVFCYMASVIIFFISARYRLPIVPFLIIFASYALYCLGKKIQARDVRGIALSSALLIPLSFAMNKDAEFANFVSDDEMAHYNLGTVYLRTGKLNEAITQLEKALTLNPNLAEYNKAIDLNPNLAETYNNKGNAYMRKRKLDYAIAEYNKALTLNPNLPEAHNNLSLLYYSKKNYKLAIVHCDKVAELRGSANPKLLKLLKPYR